MSASPKVGHEATDIAAGGVPGSPLLALCAALLAVSTAPASLRRIAGRAVIAAVAADCELASETVLASWHWLLNESDTSEAAEVFALLDDADVRASALQGLARPGIDLHALAVVERVLSGSAHARHLDDTIVLQLIEQSATGRRARAVAAILAAIHEARGLPAPLLRALRDRWASGNACARQAALTIALA